MFKKIIILLFIGSLLWSIPAFAEEGAKACIDCHNKVTPGTVRDHESSKHNLVDDGPDCTTCHGDAHKTMEGTINWPQCPHRKLVQTVMKIK